MPTNDARQIRVLLRTATGKDALMTTDVLVRAGIASHTCANLREIVTEMREGAGTLLLAEETLAEEGSGELI
ncbi:MAG TPA: hypothetical protein VK660_08105, partial [Xanthomonadaceae bacterium]|nr:hypothetical protein [Xanthomonadaceae bacterium]